MPATWAVLFDTHWAGPYLTAAIAIYAAFIAGDQLGLRAFPNKKVRHKRLSPHLLALFSGGAFLIFLVESAVHRAELFVPYSTDLSGQTARGNVTAWVVLLGSVVFLRISSRPRFTMLMLPFAAGALFLV